MYETSYKPSSDSGSSDPVTSDSIQSSRASSSSAQPSSSRGSSSQAPLASSSHTGMRRWWGELPPQRRRVIVGLIGLVVILLVVSVIAAVLNRPASFTGNDVAIALEVPSEVRAGEVFNGSIRVTNTELDALESVDITLSAPAGFVLRSANRTTTTPGVPAWNVERIESGQVYEIQFQAVAQAEAGSGIELRARLSYSPESVSSTFGADVAATILLAQSDVSLATSIPANISPGGELTYTITVRHQGEVPLEDAAVKLILPAGFRVLSADPVATNRKDLWNIGALSDEERVITVRGVLNGDAGTEHTFTAQAGVVNATGTFVAQEERVDTVQVVDAEVDVDVTVNGVSSATVEAAGEIEVAVNYRNAGDDTLRNVQLAVAVAGNEALLDLADWQVDRGQREGQSALFGPDTLPELAQLNPGDEGRLLFTIRLPERPTLERGTRNVALTFTPKVTTTVGAASPVTIELEGTPASAKIGTDVSLEAEIVYYNEQGMPLGEGPIPPQVGERTTYIVRATLSNTTSIVNNVSVQIRLANGVELLEQPVVNDGSVSTSLRRVTWQIGRVGTEVGLVLPGLTIEFPVQIRPTANDVGAHVPLISQITLSGTDGYTQLPVSAQVGALDSSLPTDATAQEGLTRVRE